MIVEFLSCSATGKSTINTLLRKQFGGPKRLNAPAGSPKHYPDQREKFRYALANMGDRVLEIEHNRQRRCLHRRLNGHYHAREAGSGKLICYDEGTIQCLGSLFHTYNELPSPAEVRRLLDGWPLPDLAIILDVDKNTVLERKIKRDGHLPVEYVRISKHFDIQRAIIDLFIPIFDEEGFPYVRLDNNYSSPEALLVSTGWEKLVNRIDRRLTYERRL